MKNDVIKITSPIKLNLIDNGGIYSFSSIKFGQPNLFTRLSFHNEIIIKIPSKRCIGDFEKFIKYEEVDPEDIRSNEDIECFDNIDKALKIFPEFDLLSSDFIRDIIHYLIVFRLQYERIKSAKLVNIPQAKFALLFFPRFLFRKDKLMPAVFQERVYGIRLFDMVEPYEGVFLKKYLHMKSIIKPQLEVLIDSDLHNHIDWNIENFVLEEKTNKLFYIDSKPTTLVSRFSVNHNLKSLKECFLN